VSNLNDEQLSDQRMVTAVLNGYRYAFGLIIKKTEGLVAQMTFKMISMD
jgi:RNA polymerase sigma-70 factor (ECF subfamily)